MIPPPQPLENGEKATPHGVFDSACAKRRLQAVPGRVTQASFALKSNQRIRQRHVGTGDAPTLGICVGICLGILGEKRQLWVSFGIGLGVLEVRQLWGTERTVFCAHKLNPLPFAGAEGRFLWHVLLVLNIKLENRTVMLDPAEQHKIKRKKHAVPQDMALGQIMPQSFSREAG